MKCPDREVYIYISIFGARQSVLITDVSCKYFFVQLLLGRQDIALYTKQEATEHVISIP